MSNWSKCCKLSEKVGNGKNVEIWMQNVKSIKLLKFAWKNRNHSKCSNLSEKCQSGQNVANWVKKLESVKMLKFG